ncbi:MlaC/ttg2D family ABC transporter substrate-binding protein [Limnobacter parvus]|uniref:ABC transporter substrate-binding protein n=1 Tax=Limnobacter parvus TaxID=2939690 RepID=A0ABT1XCX3_9BURK|nr:ABC transporter substrate-binding protein [Limnobacter parvus]MCR2745137.1 ABC transporter substrate-binding protein [Limnobacter parvus]
MNTALNRMFRWAAVATLGLGLLSQPALAQEVPANEFVEKFSNEVLADIKARKQELIADPRKLDALIDQKVMPNVNFRRMTQLVVGRPWREATPEQREQIIKEFRVLLVKTYSGALSQVGDQTLQVDRLRARPEDTDVIVNSRVIQKGAPPIDLAYRVEKKDGKWLIYDLSVLGLWLVDSYKAQFGPVLASTGVDGLIQTLKTLNTKG